VKKLMLLVIALAALFQTATLAQNIVGTWQGTLQIPQGPALRTVLKISRADDESLKALFYSIDQGGQPINASAMTQQGSTVKMTIAAIGGNYEGKLSADGSSISGSWTQAGNPLPLNLARATPATEWTIPEPLPPPKAMPAGAKPTFEVATIKPSRPEERFSLLVNRSGMLNTTATSVSDLIKFAYNVHPRQIAHGPAWLETDKFDVTGKPDVPGTPSIAQLRSMVQQLLADRFQLTFHREPKELSVYAITVLKTGTKLTKNDSNPNGLPGYGGGGPRGIVVRNSTMAEWAAVLQANIVDQPVVDQTGLGSNRYDFILKWTPDQAQLQLANPGAPAPTADNPDAPPDLFTAFEQQLGLKLVSTKAPVDVLVIDRAEKPSEN
jgi:uncharacterized protein (TIGR03435 family)